MWIFSKSHPSRKNIVLFVIVLPPYYISAFLNKELTKFTHSYLYFRTFISIIPMNIFGKWKILMNLGKFG